MGKTIFGVELTPLETAKMCFLNVLLYKGEEFFCVQKRKTECLLQRAHF